MRARDAVYYSVTHVLGRLLQGRLFVSLFSVFTFPSRGKRLLDPGVQRWLRSPGVAIGLVTILLLFGVNLVWSAARARLLPDLDAGTRNFFEDWPNIVNYLLICPVYLTFGLCFLGKFRR